MTICHLPTEPFSGRNAANTLLAVADRMTLLVDPDRASSVRWKLGAVRWLAVNGGPMSDLCQSITPASEA